MDTHLKLHATQLKQLTQTHTHPLHDLNTYSDPPRNIKATIFNNNERTNIIISQPDITPEEYRKTQTHSHYHHLQCLSSKKNNKVTNTTPYDIHLSEQTLPCYMRTKLEQLRVNKSPLLQSYIQ